MGGVLALDLATKTGWAVVEEGTAHAPTLIEVNGGKEVYHPVSGTIEIGRDHYSMGKFLDTYRRWLLDMLRVHGISRLSYEAPWVNGDTSQATARKLFGLSAVTEMVCEMKTIPCMESTPTNVRTHFIGTNSGGRNTLKRMTIEHCQALGWNPVDDNEADALALLDFTLAWEELRNRKWTQE